MPTFVSKFSAFSESSCFDARSRATPPPGTIPSATAARVALSASLIRSFFSFTWTSLAPPTFRTATPRESLASLCWSFSFSYSDVTFFICSLICSHLSSTFSLEPPPSSMRVSSWVIETCLAEPRCEILIFSSLCPSSSVMNVAPVRAAMSCIISFLFSPNSGALVAVTWRPRSLFKIRVVRASPSTFSAMMTNGLCSLWASSRTGISDCGVLIFLSVTRISALSKVHVCVLTSVMKYLEM